MVEDIKRQGTQNSNTADMKTTKLLSMKRTPTHKEKKGSESKILTDSHDLKKFNAHFRVVLTPNDREQFGNRRRFMVTANSLINYVGFDNANTAVLRAFNSQEYKYTVRLRKYGRIDFYSK